MGSHTKEVRLWTSIVVATGWWGYFGRIAGAEIMQVVMDAGQGRMGHGHAALLGMRNPLHNSLTVSITPDFLCRWSGGIQFPSWFAILVYLTYLITAYLV